MAVQDRSDYEDDTGFCAILPIGAGGVEAPVRGVAMQGGMGYAIDDDG